MTILEEIAATKTLLGLYFLLNHHRISNKKQDEALLVKLKECVERERGTPRYWDQLLRVFVLLGLRDAPRSSAFIIDNCLRKSLRAEEGRR